MTRRSESSASSRCSTPAGTPSRRRRSPRRGEPGFLGQRHPAPRPVQTSALGPGREEVDYRDFAADPLYGHGDRLEVTGNTWASPTARPEYGTPPPTTGSRSHCLHQRSALSGIDHQRDHRQPAAVIRIQPGRQHPAFDLQLADLLPLRRAPTNSPLPRSMVRATLRAKYPAARVTMW